MSVATAPADTATMAEFARNVPKELFSNRLVKLSSEGSLGQYSIGKRLMVPGDLNAVSVIQYSGNRVMSSRRPRLLCSDTAPTVTRGLGRGAAFGSGTVMRRVSVTEEPVRTDEVMVIAALSASPSGRTRRTP